MLPPPSSRRPKVLLAVLGAAILVAAVVVVVLEVGRRGSVPVAADATPVIVLHGYGGSVEDMEPLADTIRATGREVTVVALPENNTGDLVAAGSVVDGAVGDVLARTGKDQVDVVGYSAGGVLARYWVAAGGADRARRVVTLGSPHHGSDGSDVFPECLEACRQLQPGSDFLEQLNSGDETPDGPDWVSLWSTTDDAVQPPSSSELDGALNLSLQDVCADEVVKHAGLPTDPLAMNLVAAELAAPQPTAFGPGDCSELGGS